jgi:hypothetical protein
MSQIWHLGIKKSMMCNQLHVVLKNEPSKCDLGKDIIVLEC